MFSLIINSKLRKKNKLHTGIFRYFTIQFWHMKQLFTLAILVLLSTGVRGQQMATNVGLILEIDSADNIRMPRIVKIIPGTAADAELEVKVGMYVLKVDDLYCRNAPLKKMVDYINTGDEEGTPVSLAIGDDKNKVPQYPFVMRRGKTESKMPSRE